MVVGQEVGWVELYVIRSVGVGPVAEKDLHDMRGTVAAAESGAKLWREQHPGAVCSVTD